MSQLPPRAPWTAIPTMPGVYLYGLPNKPPSVAKLETAEDADDVLEWWFLATDSYMATTGRQWAFPRGCQFAYLGPAEWPLWAQGEAGQPATGNEAFDAADDVPVILNRLGGDWQHDSGHIPAAGPVLQPGPSDHGMRAAALEIALRLLSMALSPHTPRSISITGPGMVDGLVSAGGREYTVAHEPGHRFAEHEVNGTTIRACGKAPSRRKRQADTQGKASPDQ